MKSKALILVLLLIIFSAGTLRSNEATTSEKKSSVTVYSSPGLISLASAWAMEYSNANPGTSVRVVQTPKSVIADIEALGGNICFVQADNSSSGEAKEGFRLVVGRDVFVPIMNLKNPYIKEIETQGISRDNIAITLANNESLCWGTLLNSRQQSPVHYFILNDPAARSAFDDFLGSPQTLESGMRPLNKDELISAVEKDIYAIGFCRFNDILTPDGKNFNGTIRLMPLDRNGNGRMDYMEKIYDNPQDFSRGVWIGKYPKALARNIYAVSDLKPTGQAELNFLGWVLGKGQTVLNSNGYCDLLASERESQINTLTGATKVAGSVQEARPLWRIAFMAVIFLILFGAVLDLIIGRFRRSRFEASGILLGKRDSFDENNVILPKGLYFDKTHTWAFMEKDGMVKVGIDDFLQHVTGPITSIGIKNPGVRINKGDQLCVMIQKGKHLVVYAPVSGIIREQNPALFGNSSLVNNSPYGEGWVCTIEPSNWLREIGFLSMADKYRTWLTSEFMRLKDFFATAIQSNPQMPGQIVLQDGGALNDHALADLGPEVWEDFQTRFINTSR